jgi:hypothetical protein
LFWWHLRNCSSPLLRKKLFGLEHEPKRYHKENCKDYFDKCYDHEKRLMS